MKIELTQYHDAEPKTSVVINSNSEDEDIFEVCELLKQALLGMGYHPNSVKEGFNEVDDTEVDNNSGEKVESCDN